MRRAWRLLAGFALALVLLAGGAWLALDAWLESAGGRSAIERVLGAESGYPVALAGDFKVVLLPAPGVSGTDLRVYPADGMGPMLTGGRYTVALALRPLLRREILVADYGDPAAIFSNCSFCSANEPARIMIFSYEGALLDEIRGDGTTYFLTRFARLQGLAAGADGRIFAADPLGGRILVFDRVSGAILDRLGVKGEAPGQLMAPSDVWLDPATGDLFISNNLGARRVEVLRGAGGQP